jgi:hypothetical protein
LSIYFASVLGISTYGLTFERPLNYTLKLYGLIYCARLIPLEISLPRFRHPMPFFTTTPGKHINQSLPPSLCQLSLAVEFVIHCFQSLPRMPAKQNKSQNLWSLHPSRHRDVRRLLQDSGLSFDFYDIDDPFKCTREYDTTVMGRFPCWDTRCTSKGWSSNMILVTIRLYPDSRYNIRVYNQRCQGCGKMSRPRLDGSYTERVVYRLVKWSGINVEPPFFSCEYNRPHLTALCEGCWNGRCNSQAMSMPQRPASYDRCTQFVKDCMSASSLTCHGSFWIYITPLTSKVVITHH